MQSLTRLLQQQFVALHCRITPYLAAGTSLGQRLLLKSSQSFRNNPFNRALSTSSWIWTLDGAAQLGRRNLATNAWNNSLQVAISRFSTATADFQSSKHSARTKRKNTHSRRYKRDSQKMSSEQTQEQQQKVEAAMTAEPTAEQKEQSTTSGEPVLAERRRDRKDQGKQMNKRARMIQEENRGAGSSDSSRLRDPEELAKERLQRQTEVRRRIAIRIANQHLLVASTSGRGRVKNEGQLPALSDAEADALVAKLTIPEEVPESEMRKVKYALVVSYRGTGYKGLQINPNMETIEAVLQDALYNAGMISDDNYGELQKIGWTRAARTDKGVHAAANVVAAKLLIHPNWTAQTIIDRIHMGLPDHIRIQHVERVINSFDSKHQASSRSYEYIIPSFAFVPVSEYPEGVLEKMLQSVPRINPDNLDSDLNFIATSRAAGMSSVETKDAASTATSSDAESTAAAGESKQPEETSKAEETSMAEAPSEAKRNKKRQQNDDDDDDETNEGGDDVLRLPEFACSPLPEALRTYRMSPERRAQIDAILKNYEGTKNHHNFTKRRAPTDGSCKRYITQVYTSGFFYLDGVEFVHIRIEGQSFMIHQIRKMIGFVIAQCRGILSPDLWDRVFTLERIRIPIAPALGLLLGRVHFKHYDNKLVELNATALRVGKPEDVRRPFEDIYTEIEGAITAFKEKYIYSEICTKELARQEAWAWLHWVNDDKFWGQPQSDGLAVRRERIISRENAEAEEKRRAEIAARGAGQLTYTKSGDETVVISDQPLEKSTVALQLRQLQEQQQKQQE